MNKEAILSPAAPAANDVIYNTFINMETKAMIICVIEVVAMFGFSLLTLKMGWVSKEQLAASKQAAIDDAVAAE